MSRDYPQAVYDQQAKVKREIRKLNKMRKDHLIATGQMPAAYFAAKRGEIPPLEEPDSEAPMPAEVKVG